MRLFVGGLFHTVTENDLREKFSRFGTVEDVEIKVRMDDTGAPLKTFGFVNMKITDESWRRCMAAYNGTRWKGKVLQVQLAKESFLDRFQRERIRNMKLMNTSLDTTNEPVMGHQKIISEEKKMKGAVPGTEIAGKEKWVVGKYGRILPIVNIRRKDKKKVVKMDPSKYVHCVKQLDPPAKAVKEESSQNCIHTLTWELTEHNNNVTRKRKGIFPKHLLVQEKKKNKYCNRTSVTEVDSNSSNRDDELMVMSTRDIAKRPGPYKQCMTLHSNSDVQDIDNSNTESVATADLEGMKHTVAFNKAYQDKQLQSEKGGVNNNVLGSTGRLHNAALSMSTEVTLYDSDIDISDSVALSGLEKSRNRKLQKKIKENKQLQTVTISDCQKTDIDNHLTVTKSLQFGSSDSDMKDTASKIPAFKGTVELYQKFVEKNVDEGHICSNSAVGTDKNVDFHESPVAKFKKTEPLSISTKPSRTIKNLNIPSENKSSGSESNGRPDDENVKGKTIDCPIPCEIPNNKSVNLPLDSQNTFNHIIESEESGDDILDLLASGKMSEVKQFVKLAQSAVTNQLSQTVNMRKENYPYFEDNKEPTTHGFSNGEQLSSNQKRLDSLRKKQKQAQDRKNLVTDALVSVDRKSSNRVVFYSDSEEELNHVGGVPVQQLFYGLTKKIHINGSTLLDVTSKETQSFNRIKSPMSKGLNRDETLTKLALFEESDSDVQEEDVFKIQPQYEGKKGKKLWELESRYGQDSRFRLDQRFLDSESEGNEGEEHLELELPSEKDNQLKILNEVVGKEGFVVNGSRKKKTFKNAFHYDPTKEEHKQFELQAQLEKKCKQKKKDKDCIKLDKLSADPVPTISDVRFYQVDSSLKTSFDAEKNDEKPFSLLSLFGTKETHRNPEVTGTVINLDTNEGNNNMRKEKLNVISWQQSLFSIDSSGDEENIQGINITKHQDIGGHSMKDNDVCHLFAPHSSTFFFTENDKRISVGVSNFCRKEDIRIIHEEWLQKRQDHADAYRAKRKWALRNMQGQPKYLALFHPTDGYTKIWKKKTT